MPIIDGKVHRSRYTSLKLNELSSVDRPAQPGALALIMKRHDDTPTPTPTPTPTATKGDDMELKDALAKIETLTGQMTAANAQITDLTAKVTTEKERADKAEADLKTEAEAHTATKAELVKATDEEITVGGETMKRSEVGEQPFRLAKAMRDERDMARIEKRVETEFAHLAGKAEERAALVKAVEAIKDEETRKAVEAILAAAEKVTIAAFSSRGQSYEQNQTEKAALASFDAEVSKIMAEDKISKDAAMEKVRKAKPDLFKQYQGWDA